MHEKELIALRMKRSCPVISHLLFVDDAAFFMEATEHNALKLKKILDSYCKASGQAVNFLKSSIYFSKNTSEGTKIKLQEVFGVDHRLKSGKYLGVPVEWGRFKKEMLAFLKDRIVKKLQGWKQKALSLAGKEVLIKAIISAIPSYLMSCFSFPKEWCAEVNALIANFWWGQS